MGFYLFYLHDSQNTRDSSAKLFDFFNVKNWSDGKDELTYEKRERNYVLNGNQLISGERHSRKQ